MTSLARRYARALFEVAQERDAVDPVAADLAAIDTVLQDPELRGIVAREDLSARAISGLTSRLAEGRHELVQNLLHTLESRRRHTVLLGLRESYDALVRAARGEITGTAEVAREVGDEQRRALEELAGRLSGKRVHLRFQQAPELIGGVRLRLGNTLYDGSVATRLEELQKKLLEAPLRA